MTFLGGGAGEFSTPAVSDFDIPSDIEFQTTSRIGRLSGAPLHQLPERNELTDGR